MKMEQVAMAVVNDQGTLRARANALALWKEGHDTAAVHSLLPTIFDEIRKPIYHGVRFDEGSWSAARAVLDFDIDYAIAERNRGPGPD
jgi:hypothetical protein